MRAEVVRGPCRRSELEQVIEVNLRAWRRGPCFERRFPDTDEAPLRSEDHTGALATSWAPVELGPVLDGTQLDPPPAILTRPDGRALLYAGRVHAVFGEPEACKGWLALAATAETLDAGSRVLYVDFEDTAASITSRLVALRVPVDVIRDRFVYVRPREPLDKPGRRDLVALAAPPHRRRRQGRTAIS